MTCSRFFRIPLAGLLLHEGSEVPHGVGVVFRRRPRIHLKAILSQQRAACSQWNQTSTRGWHCGHFQEGAEQFEIEIPAALQTLQGTLENVNPQMGGEQGLEEGVGTFTVEARPGRRGLGVGIKRNDLKLWGAGILHGGG